MTVAFEDGRVAGSASCNEYTADYTLSGEGLGIGQVARTRRACASNLMAREERFLDLSPT